MGGEGRSAENKHGRGLAGRPWSERRPALRSLFEEISPRYDRLNRILSFGLDRGWRRWAVRRLGAAPPGPWCDLASGTGDLAVEMLRCGRAVVRADLSPALLRLASAKLDRRSAPAPGPPAAPAAACEMDALPFRDAAFAAIGQAFALRHCRSFESFFAELYRVLLPGGRIAILDMRDPSEGRFARPYRFYFRRGLPRLAALLGGDRQAYEMMVASVRGLPPEERILRAARAAGLEQVASERGLFGSVRLIVGRKPGGT